MSYRTLTTKPLNASLKTLLKRGGHIGLGLSAFTPVLALANPTGGHVVSGQATIANPSANGTIITQRSNSAIIDWQQFNIGAGQFVQFLQPSSSSVVLNRVIGNSSSSILGSLTANGQVFLVNTNGVYFGNGSSIDTQGFLASTLGITDQNFLAHNYVFNQPGAANATVINDGSITSHHGGYVVLAGDYAENDGIISAQSGHVVLASGSKATLALNGNNLVNFAVNQSTLAQYAGVKNTGSILADGGTVIMTADVANLLKSTVVNNTGLVEAHAISKDGGVIQLLASGGNISNAGTLDVSATGKDQAGGDVTLKGDEKTFLANTSNIDATGNGANGGSVEVSGKTIGVRGTLGLGKGGRLLLDPESIELVSGSGSGGGVLGLGTGATTAGTVVSKVGVETVETQLNAGATVAISAHHRIFASTDATNITATTGPTAASGVLKFKVGAGGVVNLSGVDITIAGKLQASMGNGSFGYLEAGSIDLNASTGSVVLRRALASSQGAITKFSAKATTGTLTINSARLTASGAGGEDGIGLDAKTTLSVDATIGASGGYLDSNVTMMGGVVNDAGSVFTSKTFSAVASAGYVNLQSVFAKQGATIKATGGDINLHEQINATSGNIAITDKKGNLNAGTGGTAVVAAGDDVTINVAHIKHIGVGGLILLADDLTVNGVFGSNTAAGFEHVLTLSGASIDVNNNIKASQLNINSDGGNGHLVYTGKNATFALSASAGDLNLGANIGSAAAPVAYNVSLSDKGHDINIERSIYTGHTASGAAANITATQTFSSAVSGQHGVHLGNSDDTAITLSAKGSVTFTGANVLVGETAPGISQGAITVNARNITFTANGAGSHTGDVQVEAGAASASFGLLDRSIAMNATGNISMTGRQVQIFGGQAHVEQSGSAGNASDLADVTLSAHGNVTLKGANNGGGVTVAGGSVGATAASLDAGSLHNVDVEADVSITAGKAINLSGEDVFISGGRAQDFFASADHINSAVVVTGSAKATLNAGTTVTITAGSGNSGTAALRAGSETGRSVQVHASGAAAKATVAVDTSVSVTGGSAIVMTGHAVHISAGSAVGQVQGGGSPSNVTAQGEGAMASTDITANTALTAGTGGITLTGKGLGAGVVLHGASSGGAKQHVSASSGADALSSVHGRVDLNTTGNVKLTAATGVVLIVSGNGAAANAIASAESGSASVKADTGVSISGKSVTASAGSVLVGEFNPHNHDGYAAYQAVASAGSNGVASVDGEANISITATGGNITLRGLQHVALDAGYGLAAGSIDHAALPPTTSLIPGGTSTSFSLSHNVFSNVLHGAQAKADGSGAQATLKASAGLSLTATGAISVTQTVASGSASLQVAAGATDGRYALPHAQNGGHASIDLTSGVNLTAGGAVTLSGHHVGVIAGPAAAVGASSSKVVHTVQHCTSASNCGPSTGTSSHFIAHQATANGAGAVSLFDTDASISIKGSSIAVTATSGASVFGGVFVGSRAKLQASHGSVSEDHKANVNLTATGAVTFTVSDDVEINAGFDAGYGAIVTASNGGVANLKIENGVNITAATMAVAAGEEVEIHGGGSAGYGAILNADGGKAGLTALSSLDITVANAFSAKLTGHSASGDIGLGGGRETAFEAKGYGTSGQVLFAADAGLNLIVSGSKGTITLDTGKHADARISIGAGGSAGLSDHLGAAGNNGTATITADADIDLSAKSTISMHAGGSLFIYGASSDAKDADVTGAFGGKAKLDVSGSVNVSGANVTLLAGASAGVFGGGSEIGSGARVIAGANGSASLISDTNTTVTATGTLSVTAGTNLRVIAGGVSHGRSAQVSFQSSAKNGKSSVDIESNLTLSGNTAVSLAAKGHVTVAGEFSSSGSGLAGYRANVAAGSHDTATFTDDEKLSIVTKGAFSAVGQGVAIFGGSEMGYGAVVSAIGAGAKATINANGSVAISAANVNISGARSVAIRGGWGAGADFDSSISDVVAKNAGTATLSGAAGVSITAANAFSAKLTGVSHSGGLFIEGGEATAESDNLQATNNGHANLNASAGVSIAVTGKGGTLSLNTGKNAGTLSIVGQERVADDLRASADTGGAIAATASDSVKLSALGAVTVTAADSEVTIEAGSSMAREASMFASHNGHIAVTATSDVDITGGAVTISARTVDLGGGRFDNGEDMIVGASNGGSANAKLSASVNLQALTGGITVNATTAANPSSSGIRIQAADEDDGEDVTADANGANAKATATLANNVSMTAATNISLTAKENLVVIGGGSSMGTNASASASHGGKATIAESADVSFIAGGAFTVKAGAELLLEGGGGFLGAGAKATAQAPHANASVTVDGSLAITAKSITASGSRISVDAGYGVGRFVIANAHSGGAAALNVKGGVSLTATGGSITLTGKHEVGVFGGQQAGAGSSRTFDGSSHFGTVSGGSYSRRTSSSNVVHATSVLASGIGATAKVSLDASVSLTATGAITLTQTSAGTSHSNGTANLVNIRAGDSAGARVAAAALGNALTTFTANAGVNLTAGGAVSVTGANVFVQGGDRAGRGAGRTSFNSVVSSCLPGGTCSLHSSHHSSHGNPVLASGAGAHTQVNANAGVNIAGAAVTLTATKAMTLAAGGSSAAGHASIVAFNSGSAAVAVQTGIKVTTPGAFVATAGSDLRITANDAAYGGNLGHSGFVLASGGGAHAELTASNDIAITAKSVTLNATAGSLSIEGGNSIGSRLEVIAGGSSDQAGAALSGTVDITAATTLSLAGKDVFMAAGGSSAKLAILRAVGPSSTAAPVTPAPFSSVSLDTDTSLNLTAGGALTIKAGTSLEAFAGAFGASSAQVFAYGDSASAKLDSKANVNITAASVTATARSGIRLGAGFIPAADAIAQAGQGARAALDLEAGMNITATGAVSLTATRGDVDISAATGAFTQAAARAIASNGATTTLNEQVGMSITAGTTLTVKAGGDVRIGGGNGLFGSAIAVLGTRSAGTSAAASQVGVVNVNINGVTALNAGTNLSVTAGGSLQVEGGSANGLAINLFPSHTHANQPSISAGPAGGIANAQLTAGVSLNAAGDVNLQAGKDLTVAAGGGVTLAVGMTRLIGSTSSGRSVTVYTGDNWAGGSANLTADVSATVTAGHDLTVTAGAGGAGDLQVEGLRPDRASSGNTASHTRIRYTNVAAVRAGSVSANAVVSMTGNATLNAGSDIIINAKGNASIVGGSIGTLRADHTRGNVSITGSADATLHAGHDVVLNNITGSLTVAGVNVNASHAGQVFVDAFGSTGQAVVTGHADALISAGNAVRTVTAIGKAFNVVGGNSVEVVAVGSSGTIVNRATGTANAGVVAGGSITVTAKGDLNVLGGQRGLVSANAKGHSTSTSLGSPSSGHHGGSRIAALSATAGISAKGAVAINAAGSGVIAAGDGLKAVSSFDFSSPSGASPRILGGFGTAQANGDVGAGITAGTTLGLTVGKSLLVRGGSGAVASAQAFFVFVSQVQATANAKVTLVSGGDMTITTTHGDASFAAGTLATAKTLVIEGFSASGQAATHVDATVQAGGNLTLNVGRNLVVTGGPETQLGSFSASSGFEAGAIAVGRGATAKTSVTAHATFTAGGNLTATLHGGDATIEAGNSVAVLRTVATEGSLADNSASMNADAGITIHAGGALTVTGAGGVAILPGLLPLFSSAGNPPAIDVFGSAGPAHGTIVSSVKISGKGVNINGDKHVFIENPSSSFGFPSFFSGEGLKMDGTVSIVSTSGAPVFSASPLTIRAPLSTQGGVNLAPMTSTTVFGGARTLSFMPSTDAGATAPFWTVPVSSTAGGVQTMSQTLSLDTLQSQALVVSLVTVVAPVDGDAPSTATPQAVLFTPGDLTAGFASGFPASCGTLLLAERNCRAGGR